MRKSKGMIRSCDVLLGPNRWSVRGRLDLLELSTSWTHDVRKVGDRAMNLIVDGQLAGIRDSPKMYGGVHVGMQMPTQKSSLQISLFEN